MAGNINKRQQVRNERALQELIKTVPGNDRCAECSARNPGWASWSLGIFLCIRCAALHRKLGTHISKVKSLSMDSWSAEQVENMKRIGNITSNKLYNPRNTRAQMPIDADEMDGTMERFIRQKYEYRTFQTGNDSSSPGSRHNTGSTSSDDRPPALPPKPNKRFFFPSLRSASSTVPRQGTLSPPTSPGFGAFGSESSPPSKDKNPAKFLGAQVGTRDDGFEHKIQYLKDMGFLDERKNATVLRGLDGNVDRAVETLIRLGEGADGVPNEAARQQLPTPRATPVNGITVEKTRPSPVASRSNNPFDPDMNKSLPPPPQSPSDRSLSPPQAYNPFIQLGQQFAQAQTPSIDQALGNLQISQQPPDQTPQLFPNTTGGYSNSNSNQATYNPFLQQAAAPPVPQIPQQYSQFAAPTPFNPTQQSFSYPQPQPQLQPQPTAAAPNPFLRTSRSQNFNPNSAFDTQGPFNAYSTNTNAFATNNAFHTQPQQAAPHPQLQPQNTAYHNPFQSSNQPTQSGFVPTSNLYQSPFGINGNIQQSPFEAPNGNTQQSYFQGGHYQTPNAPFASAQQPFQSPASAPPQQQSMYQPPQQQHASSPNSDPLYQQPMFPRHDKTSILALYSMPQPAPQHPQHGDPSSAVPQQHDFAHNTPKRSVTMPAAMASGGQAAAKNPFGGLAGKPPSAAAHSSAFASSTDGAAGGMSRESVDFAGLALMNGRHSPDAFSGLSARLR